jgi:hypothetical protein
MLGEPAIRPGNRMAKETVGAARRPGALPRIVGIRAHGGD